MRATSTRTPQSTPARRPTPPSGAAASPVAARAALLQRVAGNHAAGRVLSRWVKHPDPEKKSVMVPDVVAEDYAHFNPPQNA